MAMTSLIPPLLTAQSAPSLRIGLVTRANTLAPAASGARGARLGAAEAKETAALFGGDVLLFEEAAAGSAERAAKNLLANRKVQILIGSAAQDVEVLSRLAESHRVIFFNIASRDPALRSACRRYTFHIEADDSMYADAAKRVSAMPSAAVLWAPTLQRYGASQINDRYRAKYGAPMDGAAWAGWVAVKIASEAALRARSANAAAILAYLETPSTNFDGHKGWPLSFRAADHRLRQPLYVVAAQTSGARGLRDVPELSAIAGGASAVSNPNQALDALMPRSRARCAWRR
ncbi:MAG TPA: ABC transporter substrate-binding protein [Gemmatimonadaceae bacterium]|nr:ABC transporter substrate-binding protein [Gemmatimonadaceae bacterium]